VKKIKKKKKRHPKTKFIGKSPKRKAQTKRILGGCSMTNESSPPPPPPSSTNQILFCIPPPPPQGKKKIHNPETPTPIYNPFPLSPVCFPGKFEQKKNTYKIFLGNQLLIEWKGKKWRQRETRVGWVIRILWMILQFMIPISPVSPGHLLRPLFNNNSTTKPLLLLLLLLRLLISGTIFVKLPNFPWIFVAFRSY